jgi:hypothetical protein
MIKLLILIFSGCILCSCFSSSHFPADTPETAIKNDAVVGKWLSHQKEDTIVQITAHNEKYNVTAISHYTGVVIWNAECYINILKESNVCSCKEYNEDGNLKDSAYVILKFKLKKSNLHVSFLNGHSHWDYLLKEKQLSTLTRDEQIAAISQEDFRESIILNLNNNKFWKTKFKLKRIG